MKILQLTPKDRKNETGVNQQIICQIIFFGIRVRYTMYDKLISHNL